MDKNIIKKAVTGIEFTEESKQRIFEGFERKKLWKKIFIWKELTVGVIVTAYVIFMRVHEYYVKKQNDNYCLCNDTGWKCEKFRFNSGA